MNLMALILLLLLNCPQEGERFYFNPPVIEVELGKAFTLEIQRTRPSPKPWGALDLKPLTARLMETEKQENKEIRRYQCYAFSLDPIRLVYKDAELTLQAVSSLDPENPGPVEPPMPPFPAPVPWAFGLSVGAGSVLLVMILIWGLRKSRRPKPPKTLFPRQKALKGLAELDLNHGDFYEEVSCLVRRYIEERFSVRAPNMTTEELLNASKTKALINEPLRDVLDFCDDVKFGKRSPTQKDRDDLIETVKNFLQEGSQEHELPY